MLELSARLEDAGKSVCKSTNVFGLKAIPSKHFMCSEGFQVQTAIPLFTVNAPYHCAPPSCTRKNWANREVHKKLIRNPPIRNAHIISLQLWISERAFVH